MKPLLALVRAGRMPAERDESVQALIASLGGPQELAMVLELAEGQGNLSPERRAALVEALIRATEQRKVVPAGDLSRLGRLLDGGEDALRRRAARAAGALEGHRTPAPARRARPIQGSARGRQGGGIEALMSLADPASRQVVEGLAGPGMPPDVQMLALAALAAHDDSAAGRAASWLEGVKPEQAALGQALLGRFLDRRGGPSTSPGRSRDGRSIPTWPGSASARSGRPVDRRPTLSPRWRRPGGLPRRRAASPARSCADSSRRWLATAIRRGERRSSAARR